MRKNIALISFLFMAPSAYGAQFEIPKKFNSIYLGMHLKELSSFEGVKRGGGRGCYQAEVPGKYFDNELFRSDAKFPVTLWFDGNQGQSELVSIDAGLSISPLSPDSILKNVENMYGASFNPYKTSNHIWFNGRYELILSFRENEVGFSSVDVIEMAKKCSANKDWGA